MKYIILALAFAMSAPLCSGQAGEQVDDAVSQAQTEEEYAVAVAQFMSELEPRKGEINLSGVPVTLSVPAGMIYYSQADTKRILEDLWGNAPGYEQAGMLANEGADLSAIETWGAIISYEDTGYVSDADARDIDYDDLLKDMKSRTRAESKQNVQDGYPSMELVGWATAPRYEAGAHRLYWAKELVFDEAREDPTLNYDMRMLGRGGVLSINFVSNMSQLDSIESVAASVLAAPQFNEGQAYGDYVKGDATAGYGIAALVAGGAGVAALKKGGFFAALLLFLKKGWVLVFAFGAAIWGGIKRMFGAKS